jgi:hypothetical protein
MISRSLQTLLGIIVLMVCSLASADDAEEAARTEARKQEAFRAGVAAFVDDLNRQDYEQFVARIDRADMVERIYGLRLIDQRIKRQFAENLESSFGPMVQAGAGIARAGIVPVFRAPEGGARYTLLGIESRGDLGRAVVRIDLDDFQFNYQEFDLRLDEREQVVVVDWTDYLAGVTFSESIGRYLVLTTPSKPALRKMLEIRNVSERELYLFGELLKAARDGNLDKFAEVRDSMQPRFHRERIVVESAVHAAKARKNRRAMVAAVAEMAEYYPEEPLYSLMLLDYLFPNRKYEEGIAALNRLARDLGFPDAAMDARLSAAFLAAGSPAEAVAHAQAAVDREPGLELGWLSALNARNAARDFAGSVQALARLESDFGYDLGPETLKKSRVFGDLMASSEFSAWLASR